MARLKDNESILKTARKEQADMYKGITIRLSNKTFQARRDWHELFKVKKSKDFPPRLLYPARLLFKIEGEIRSFPGKKKLKALVNTKPVL